MRGVVELQHKKQGMIVQNVNVCVTTTILMIQKKMKASFGTQWSTKLKAAMDQKFSEMALAVQQLEKEQEQQAKQPTASSGQPSTQASQSAGMQSLVGGGMGASGIPFSMAQYLQQSQTSMMQQTQGFQNPIGASTALQTEAQKTTQKQNNASDIENSDEKKFREQMVKVLTRIWKSSP